MQFAFNHLEEKWYNIRNYGSRDEPPMTACGGNFIGGEIKRNEHCPLVASSVARLRARNSLIAARNPRFPKGVARGVRGLATIELADV